MTETIDPGRAYELQFAEREDALRRASEYETQGWPYMAKLARRQAAGHKAAMTRIARREGWL